MDPGSQPPDGPNPVPPAERTPSSPSGGGADEGGGGGQTAPLRDQNRPTPNPVPPAAGRGDAERSDAGGPPSTTRSVLLLGSDHTELGEVEISVLSPNTAIGISRGRFPKGYAHVDPNEDAVFAATDGTTTVLAVADGHHGFDAAKAAITALAGATAKIIGRSLESIVRDLTASAIAAVAENIPSLPPPRDTSRTALTICAIRDTEFATTTIGDTTCLVATKHRVRRIGASSPFLSPDTDGQTIRVDVTEVPPNSTFVVASDGFTDFVQEIDRTVRMVSEQSPEDAVEALMAAAFAGGAGDNIAVGIIRTIA